MNRGSPHIRASFFFMRLLRKPLFHIAWMGAVGMAVFLGQKTQMPEEPHSFLIAPEKVPSCIILYVIDALRPDHLSVYGYNRDTAPTIQALAREGAAFTRCFSKSTWSLVSVESLFTGMHGSAYSDERGASVVENCLELLPECFQASGWYTGLVTENVFINARYGFAQGFDFIRDSSALIGSARQAKVEVSEATPEYLETFLDRAQGGRFFLYVHTMETHSPFMFPETLPPFFADGVRPKDDLTGWYDTAVRWADRNLGEFIELLKERNLYDNTLLIVTADHGESLVPGRSTGIHTGPPFLDRVRVPLIVRWPERIPAGTVFDDLVQHLDIAPTLLDASRIPRLPQFQGESLVALLTQGNRDALHNRTIFTVGQALADRGAAAGDRYLLFARGKAQLYDISVNLQSPADCTEGNESVVRQLREAMDGHFANQRRIFEKYKSSRQWSLSGIVDRIFHSTSENTANGKTSPESDADHKRALEALGYL